MSKLPRIALTTLVASTLAMLQMAAHALESADSMSKLLSEPWFGDYSAMKKDKVVRVLVPFSITSYYIDQGKQKGITAEYMREFESFLNKGVKKELDKVRVVLIPTKRNELISGIVEGRGDIAAASLTVTPERMEELDFSNPVYRGVRELLVTGKDDPDVKELKDLSGLEVHVRESSSYFSSLVNINKKLEAQSLDPITIVTVDENLEDEDLMELIHSDVIPAIVVDEYKAKLWRGLFDKIRLHEGVALRDGADIAWAFRKDSPELKERINAFLKNAAVGTMLGNVLVKRYFSDISSLVNPKNIDYQKRLNELTNLFEKYGKKYRIDPMLLAAQAFQESRFNNNARSKAGAVGIMQILPSTANDPNVNIKNIKQLENNIEAGAKYMRFLADHYFADEEIPELQRILFVFAAYNAGPNRVARVRKKASDPNQWFESVEWEVARAAGAEPIKYVKNIYIYYILFKNLSTKQLKLD